MSTVAYDVEYKEFRGPLYTLREGDQFRYQGEWLTALVGFNEPGRINVFTEETAPRPMWFNLLGALFRVTADLPREFMCTDYNMNWLIRTVKRVPIKPTVSRAEDFDEDTDEDPA